MASQREINKTLIDATMLANGYGTLSDAYTKMLRGFNHRGLGNQVNTNRDNGGITLLTRPNCNLTYDNIAVNRLLMPLATENAELTIQRYIRTALDPKNAFTKGVTTPLFDHRQPFIPLLTNNLLSMSGFPDVAVDVYSSKEGIRKENWAMIDGVFRITNTFDVTANFRNIAGDPITALFSAWINYAVSVKLGDMVPYAESIVENEIDYMTRIYRLVLDPSRRYVQKIAAVGAAFPNTNPIGAAFNFVGEEQYVGATDMISVNFTCIGVDYNDPISFHEFNEVVRIFNPDLEIVSYDDAGNMQVKANTSGGSNVPVGNLRYIKLIGDEIRRGNYFGTPLIHPLSGELCWYVDTDTYNQRIAI